MTLPTATPGAKMLYLIKRRPTTSREELVAHWFANHMPAVIQGQKDQAEKGRLHAWRYIATLYDANKEGEHPWDGMAQLCGSVRRPGLRSRAARRHRTRSSRRPNLRAVGDDRVRRYRRRATGRAVDAQRAVSLHTFGILQDQLPRHGEGRHRLRRILHALAERPRGPT